MSIVRWRQKSRSDSRNWRVARRRGARSMAKRAPIDEKSFHPLERPVLRDVVQHRVESNSVSNSESAKVLAMPDLTSHTHVLSEPELSLAPVVRRLDREKRVLFTREETQALDRLVHQLAARLQTQVKCSHVLRALTSVLLGAEGQVCRRAIE